MRYSPHLRRSLFVIASTVIVAPVSAESPMIVSGKQEQVYQERVSFSDLDLRQRVAGQTLRSRVKNASDRVCIQAEGFVPRYGVYGYSHQDPSLTCADLTYAQAEPQMKAVFDRAKAGQQVAITFVISARKVR